MKFLAWVRNIRWVQLFIFSPVFRRDKTEMDWLVMAISSDVVKTELWRCITAGMDEGKIGLDTNLGRLGIYNVKWQIHTTGKQHLVYNANKWSAVSIHLVSILEYQQTDIRFHSDKLTTYDAHKISRISIYVRLYGYHRISVRKCGGINGGWCWCLYQIKPVLRRADVTTLTPLCCTGWCRLWLCGCRKYEQQWWDSRELNKHNNTTQLSLLIPGVNYWPLQGEPGLSKNHSSWKKIV